MLKTGLVVMEIRKLMIRLLMNNIQYVTAFAMLSETCNHPHSKTNPVLLQSYMMSNGYKPMPLELSEVKLSPAQELLVDKLAENAHNVWAKDRIKQGWTYGIQQVMNSAVQADDLIWCFLLLTFMD